MEREIEIDDCTKIKYRITKNNIKIYNSYKVKDKALMKHILYEIARNDEYCDSRDRYIDDYIREWESYNILFRLPIKYFKAHCRDCDLTNGDSKFNLLVYAVLGRLYILRMISIAFVMMLIFLFANRLLGFEYFAIVYFAVMAAVVSVGEKNE